MTAHTLLGLLAFALAACGHDSPTNVDTPPPVLLSEVEQAEFDHARAYFDFADALPPMVTYPAAVYCKGYGGICCDDDCGYDDRGRSRGQSCYLPEANVVTVSASRPGPQCSSTHAKLRAEFCNAIWCQQNPTLCGQPDQYNQPCARG